MRGIIALTFGAALVAGCASSSRPPSRVIKQIDRALAQAPGKAQPSIIVKTDLMLARKARESGQKSAFLAFAAPNAQLHRSQGVVLAEPFLQGQRSRKDIASMSTKSVFMSCDGSIAVSQGRLTETDGTVGNYIFVWQRQRDIRPNNDDETGYRYVYFSAEPDNPQPPPRKELDIPEGGIVVEAIDATRADIASCRDRDKVYLDALAEQAAGYTSGSGHSLDRTLQWKWFADPAEQRTVEVSFWRKGARETVFTQDLPSAPN